MKTKANHAFRVERYVVDRDGREVSSMARGSLTGRLRIVDGDSSAHDPIIADMVAGSRAVADLFAAAPELAEALRDIVEKFESTGMMIIPPDLSDSIRILGRAALKKAGLL